MDRDLRLRVIFGAIDKLSAPIRRLQEGARGLSGDIRKTTTELGGLRRAQVRIAQYKAAEAQLRSTAADMVVAANATAKLKAEMEGVTRPTARMTAALEKAERREGMLTGRHEREGAKLQEMARAMAQAGHAVDDLAGHEARLADRVQETTRALEAQRTRAARLAEHREAGARLKEGGDRMRNIGALGTLTVSTPIVAFLSKSIKAANESRAALMQVQATIDSMGKGAGYTADQLKTLAERLQDTSLYDDDDIMRQVTTNLLTFGKIHGAVFERAQQAIIDYSAKSGKDLLGSTIMIAKALQDPALGMSGLGKTGTLDKEWIKANKARVQKLVDSGRVAQAQVEILAQLEHQYQGSAAAMRKATPDAAMQQQFRDLQENVGKLANEHLPKLLRMLTGAMEAFNKLPEPMQRFIIGGAMLMAILFPILTVLGTLAGIVGTVAVAFSIGFGAATVAVFGIAAAIAGLIAVGYLLYANWDRIKALFGAVWDWIVVKVKGVVAWFWTLGPTFKTIGGMMLQGLLSSLNPMVLVAHVLRLGKAAIAAIRGVLGIHSPSRVFAQIGGHLTAGLAQGIDGGAAHPVARISALGQRLTGAIAIGAAAALPAAARPSSPFGGAAASASAGSLRPIHIDRLVINQQPGQDAKSLAQQIRDELARVGRSARARDDSSYEDQD